MEAIKVENLVKHFGGLAATNDVSFHLDAGERLVIIGPNGAGKSTLFNLLNGQLKPDRGNIILFGQDVTRVSLHKRAHMGMSRSFQLTSLFPEMSVLDNIMLALHGLQKSRFNLFSKSRAYPDLIGKSKEMLSLMGLWERKETPVKLISYGEQRKLEIALCLSTDPKLLLIDEPSAGLTSGERQDVMDMIRALPSHIAVIIIDHDMDLVFGLAKRILVLHYGQVIAEGSPEEIQNHSRVKECYMGVEEE